MHPHPWFFKYAFILFDHCLRGFDDPPALDINMMNPWDERRPIEMLIILGAMSGLTWAVYTNAGPPLGLGIIFLIFVPAAVAVLGLDGDLVKAAYPLAWLRMIRDLGVYYWIVLLLITIECAAIYLLGQLPLGLIIQTAFSMFGVLSAVCLLAGALYERRERLGLIAWVSTERREERQRTEDHRRDEETITEAYGLLRAGRHLESWQMLQKWLESQHFSSDAYRWLTQQADRWEDPRYGGRLAEDWVERLLTQKQTGQAFTVVVERIREDASFRPKSAADTLSMAQFAIQGGGSPRTARILLSDFADRFPQDVRIARAADLASRSFATGPVGREKSQ